MSGDSKSVALCCSILSQRAPSNAKYELMVGISTAMVVSESQIYCLPAFGQAAGTAGRSRCEMRRTLLRNRRTPERRSISWFFHPLIKDVLCKDVLCDALPRNLNGTFELRIRVSEVHSFGNQAQPPSRRRWIWPTLPLRHAPATLITAFGLFDTDPRQPCHDPQKQKGPPKESLQNNSLFWLPDQGSNLGPAD